MAKIELVVGVKVVVVVVMAELAETNFATWKNLFMEGSKTPVIKLVGVSALKFFIMLRTLDDVKEENEGSR